MGCACSSHARVTPLSPAEPKAVIPAPRLPTAGKSGPERDPHAPASPFVPSSRATVIHSGKASFNSSARVSPLNMRADGTSKELFSYDSSNSAFSPQPPVHKFSWASLQVLHLLGKGHFGKVFAVRHTPTGKIYALKSIRAHVSTQQAEVRALQEVSGHPNVTSLYKVFSAKEHTYLLMDACHCNLFQMLVERSYFSEELCIRIVREVVAGIAHIHARNILHGDIKPENLLIKNSWGNLTEEELLRTELNVKIADFGLSYIFPPGTEPVRKAGGGTKSYSAPEKLKGQWYGPPADMWAVGVITFIMLGGYHPFDEYGEGYNPRVGHAIMACSWSFHAKDWQNISKPAQDFVARLLKKDPADRMTAWDAARHPWLNEGMASGTEPQPITTVPSWMPKMLYARGVPATPLYSPARNLTPGSHPHRGSGSASDLHPSPLHSGRNSAMHAPQRTRSLQVDNRVHAPSPHFFSFNGPYPPPHSPASVIHDDMNAAGGESGRGTPAAMGERDSPTRETTSTPTQPLSMAPPQPGETPQALQLQLRVNTGEQEVKDAQAVQIATDTREDDKTDSSTAPAVAAGTAAVAATPVLEALIHTPERRTQLHPRIRALALRKFLVENSANSQDSEVAFTPDGAPDSVAGSRPGTPLSLNQRGLRSARHGRASTFSSLRRKAVNNAAKAIDNARSNSRGLNGGQTGSPGISPRLGQPDTKGKEPEH